MVALNVEELLRNRFHKKLSGNKTAIKMSICAEGIVLSRVMIILH